MPEDLTRSRGTKPRRGAVLKCDECGREFYAAPGQAQRRRFCSKPCRNASVARTMRKACVRCGKEFSDAPSVGKKWCSWACYEADRKPRATCKRCGVALPRSARTYCSQACLWEDKRRTAAQKPCEQCGTMMRVPPHLLTNKRFCSRECGNEAKRIKGAGARIKRPDGYIQVYYPTHPDASKQGFILEHRLVAEQKYGRRILRTEHVHHINGVRDDNRPENLEVVAPGDHARVSTKMGVEKRKSLRAKLAEYERRFGPLS